MEKHTEECRILGVGFRAHTEETAWREIEKILSSRKNARIFTPNAEILYHASKDAHICELLNAAELILPDGVGVILASRILGSPLPCRITGIDTAERILEYAAARGLSVFLLGGKPNVAEKAAERLMEKHLGLNLCGTHHGYFDPDGDENATVLKKLQSARPDILFVCLGFPAQEKWIEKNTPSLPFLRLSMGLGGCLDIWSGNIKRSPRLFRRLGLEWLWRTLTSPSRLRRLPALGAFGFKVLAGIR